MSPREVIAWYAACEIGRGHPGGDDDLGVTATAGGQVFSEKCLDGCDRGHFGGAILGGAAGAIIGGAVGGGRGAATGAIIGGVTGTAIGAQGQLRPGGYRYYENGCYQQRPDGGWFVVSPVLRGSW
jgi:hypothetical protein